MVLRRSKINIEIGLNRKFSINGFVKSPTGEIITNASIYWNSDKFVNGSCNINNDGSFTIYPVRYSYYQIEVHHPNYLSATIHTKPGEFIDVLLKNEAKITVINIDPHGNPIGGAETLIHALSKKRVFMAADFSDVNGRVIFNHIKPGTYSIKTKPPLSQSASLKILDVSTTPIVVSLISRDKTFTISGRVIDAEKFIGIQNIFVNHNTYLGINNRIVSSTQTVTDKFGHFIFKHVYPGLHKIYIDEHPGYISGTYNGILGEWVVSPPIINQWIDSDINDLEIYLKPAWKIFGKVYDHTRNPISNCKVIVKIVFIPKSFMRTKGSESIPVSLITNADGYYEYWGKFELRSNEAKLFLQVSNPVFGYLKSKTFTPQSGEEYELNFFYTQQPNIMGIVKTKDGTPIQNAQITAGLGNLETNDSFYELRTTYSGINGEYGLSLQPGTYFLISNASGYEEFNFYPLHVNKSLVTKNIIMSKGDNGWKIEGHVVDEYGNSLTNMDIHILPYSENDQFIPNPSYFGRKITESLENGEFCINDPQTLNFRPKEIYRITAKDPNKKYRTSSLNNIHPGDTDILIVMETNSDCCAEIYGRVIDINENPVDHFKLLVLPGFHQQLKTGIAADYSWQIFSSHDGTFHIKGLTQNENPYTLAAHNKEHGLGISKEINVVSEKVIQNITIKLNGNITLFGRVVDAETDLPIMGAKVRAIAANNPVEQLNYLKNNDFRKTRIITFGGGSLEQTEMMQYLPNDVTDKYGQFILNPTPKIPLILVVVKSNYYPEFILQNLKFRTNRHRINDIPINRMVKSE